MKFAPRKHLPHEVPLWVPGGALFFATVHCLTRDREQLTVRPTAEVLLEAVKHYHDTGRWFARLFLLMPDHAHALLSFPRQEAMQDVVIAWKRYTARATGVVWQRSFFDHRLRSDESWELKADYIRQNPVRKGLIGSPEQWPWIWQA